MSVGKIGKIKDFDLKSGNWTLYMERLEMYFKVNKVEKDMWLAILITGVGDETYELLSTLCSPNRPAEITYEKAVTMLKNHLQPKPAVMAERYRFRQRRQKDDETITQYLTEMKKLSKTCEFIENLEENLRDQFVCGVKSDVIRQRLFAEDNLTYAGAVRLACGLEAAERDAAFVEQKTSGEIPATVHAFKTSQQSKRHKQHTNRDRAARYTDKGTDDCAACGWRGHTKDECRYKQFVCSKCKQMGHLRRVCPRAGLSQKTKRCGVNHCEVASNEQSGAGQAESSSDELEEELHQLCLNGYNPPTWVFFAPAFASSLVPVIRPDQLTSVESVTLLGAPVSPDLIKQFTEKLPNKARVLDGYGSTEAQGFMVLPDKDAPSNSNGRVINCFYYKIVDDDGKELGLNQTGELWVKGDSIIKKYHKNDISYDETFTSDGWYRTGDEFHLDENERLTFVVRKKFCFKYRGCQVAPEEVERVIASVPGVEESVVCATDNGPAAAVVKLPNAQLTKEQIHHAVKTALSEHKHLHGGIIFLPSLPHTHSGKLNRKECSKIILDAISKGECC